MLLALLALTLIAPLQQAHAVDDGALGIRPSNESDYFHLDILPGAALDAVAIVSNHTNDPVTLLNYPVDAHNTPQGTFAMGAQSDPRTGIGGWVQLDSAQLFVPPNSELTVPFRISVPENAPPGIYAGGLIIESPRAQGITTTMNGETAFRLDVVQRQGVRIYLNVAGTAVSSLEHGSLTWQQDGNDVLFTLPVRNTGNTIVHPTARLDASGWPGADLTVDFDTADSVLPGAGQELHARLQQAPPVHIGRANATLISEAGTQQAQTSLVYAPWLALIIGLLLMSATLYGVWRGARFVKRARLALAQLAADQAGLGGGDGARPRRGQVLRGK
ncbi:DUF916 domain-containing protein [Arthrobacter oryzae]|uniref:DUF916 domain-containing protein n=1 Tax=Arthrobacter oryzae TaxID=409290 RepID=A0A3N0BYL0_9MICC|nr:DUF916 domain-containing protein [Arthrobacter oryzae]